MDQKFIDLFDRYTHGGMNRREFLDRLSELAGSAAAAAALLPLLQNDYAQAAIVADNDPRLVSSKLLLARPVEPNGKNAGNHLVAIDTVDAGIGETVLIVSGSSARMAAGMKDRPVDAVVVGIVDHVDVPS